MKRILFVSYTADWTGPSNSLFHLVTRLREHYDIRVLVPEAGYLTHLLDAEGIPHGIVGPWSKRNLPLLIRSVARLHPDLVYANNTHGSSRSAFLAARLAGARFVVHVRGMLWNRGWGRLWYLNDSDAVIAVSKASASSVARFVRDGRLHVVHNGITIEDTEAVGESVGGTRETLGITHDELVIINLAHLCRRKGQMDAIETLSRVSPGRRERVHLLLVGSMQREPDYTDELIRRTRDLGLVDRVHFLGFREDTLDLLRASNVYLHTAKADPHPRAVLEAMGVGLPVVAFGVDGVAETVEDGVTGRLVRSEDIDGLTRGIRELLDNSELRTDWGTSAKRTVAERFTAEVTTRGVRRVIDEHVLAIAVSCVEGDENQTHVGHHRPRQQRRMARRRQQPVQLPRAENDQQRKDAKTDDGECE